MLTISISLSVLMLIRGASPTSPGTLMLEVGPYMSTGSRSFSQFFNTRDLRIRVTVEKEIDLNVTDSSGVVIFSVKNVDRTAEINLHIDRRGSYRFVLYNPSDSTQHGTMEFTEFNFETDLMQGAIAFSIIGVSLIIVEKARCRTKHSLLQAEQRKT